MMPTPSATQGTIWEDSGAMLMARILGNNAAVISQSSIASIDYKVFDLSSSTPGTATQTGTLVVNDVVFNALQTDARWTADAIGYNFRWDSPASFYPEGGHIYAVEITFTPIAGEKFHHVFHITAKSLWKS